MTIRTTWDELRNGLEITTGHDYVITLAGGSHPPPDPPENEEPVPSPGSQERREEDDLP